jgi:hypothetical protein
MFELITSSASALAKTVQAVAQLCLGMKTKMLTISTGEAQRPLKLRDGIDRRVREDRRRSSVGMRLRIGLWYQYHRATRAGEFDAFPRDQHKRVKIEEALLPEIGRYEFRRRENLAPVPARCALADAVDFVWAHPEVGCNATGESMAVYAINAISDYLERSFQVAVVDRRKADRRAARASTNS